MSKADILLSVYKDLNWETYIKIVDEAVKINHMSLNEDLEKQPTFYSHFAGLAAICKKDMDKAANDIETTSARLKQDEYRRCRETGDKCTDKYLESYILSHPDYIELSNKLIVLNGKYNLLKSITTALEHRKDCLIQLSANNRAETNLYTK